MKKPEAASAPEAPRDGGAPESRLRRSDLLLLAVMAIALAGRFYHLDEAPPGFFVDEAAGALNVICLEQEGVDELGRSAGLFISTACCGVFTPTYLWIGRLWVSLFGYSVASFRALTAAFSVLAVCGVYALGSLLLGRRGGLYAALIASLSPWSFHFSRIAWHPALFPSFLVWGVYFLVKGSFKRHTVISALLLAAAMYTYQAPRVQVPVIVITLAFLYGRKKAVRFRNLAFFFSVLAVFCLPLAHELLYGASIERVNKVGVVTPGYLRSLYNTEHIVVRLYVLGAAVLSNFIRHLDPLFLLISGDPNLRHSTRFTGELGWVEAALIILSAGWWVASRWFPRVPAPEAPRHEAFIPLVFAGIAGGILPAALTWEALPHALRSLGAQPFFALGAGYLLLCWVRRLPFAQLAFALLGLVFAIQYGRHFYGSYAAKSGPWFNSEVTRAAEESLESRLSRFLVWSSFVERFPGFPDSALRYYLVVYGGYSCSESKELMSTVKGTGRSEKQ